MVASLCQATGMGRCAWVWWTGWRLGRSELSRLRQRMRHEGGTPWIDQACREGLGTFPLKAKECEKTQSSRSIRYAMMG